ncbi:MAG: TVP38/TMEM64 family protein [Phormidesmis sp.]
MTWTWLRKKRLWASLAIASCLLTLVSQMPVLSWIADAHSWIGAQGIWALPTFIAIYVIAAIFGLPNIVLILAAGTLFGLTKGVISASIADTLSIAACFVIGQTMGRRWITSMVRENSRFHKLDKAFAEKGWKLVLLTRLSPVLPSNILNYGFSITCINFWEYLFFSWLGMVPVIFTYVYVGTFGATVLTLDQSSENLAFQVLGLATTIGVMFYTTKLTATALSDQKRPDIQHSGSCSGQSGLAQNGSDSKWKGLEWIDPDQAERLRADLAYSRVEDWVNHAGATETPQMTARTKRIAGSPKRTARPKISIKR